MRGSTLLSLSDAWISSPYGQCLDVPSLLGCSVCFMRKLLGPGDCLETPSLWCVDDLVGFCLEWASLLCLPLYSAEEACEISWSPR